jgi:ABC-2 type transport system permease protein
MKPIVKHFCLQFRLDLRHRTMLLFFYLMPVGFYLLVSSMMIGINPFLQGQLIPAMVIFAILSGVILGVPNFLTEAKEQDTLRSYRINGVKASWLVAMPAVSALIHMMLVAGIICASAPFIFKAPTPVSWWGFVFSFILTYYASSGLASLIGVLAENNRSAILLQQLIYLPSMLLGGLMVPVDILPEALNKIGHLLPTGYGMQIFMGWAYRQSTPYSPLTAALILFSGGTLAYLSAIALFSWETRSERGKLKLLALLSFVPYLLGAIFLV